MTVRVGLLLMTGLEEVGLRRSFSGACSLSPTQLFEQSVSHAGPLQGNKTVQRTGTGRR